MSIVERSVFIKIMYFVARWKRKLICGYDVMPKLYSIK